MSIDLNMLRALISQESFENLIQVKKIIDAEIEHSIKMSEKAADTVENLLSHDIHKLGRAVPRMPDFENIKQQAGIGQAIPMSVDARIEANYKSNLHVSESGATSSHVPLRYDLIPRSLIERAAQRYTEGAKIHGERGYQKGLLDRNFIINRINHITEHWNKLWHPDYSKADSPVCEEGIEHKSINDNLGAIIWGVAFICEVMDTKTGFELLRELRSDGRVKITPD